MSLDSLVLLTAIAVSGAQTAKPAPEPAPVVLAGEGRDCELPGGLHFIYRFASRPQLGTVVLKVQVFGPDGTRVTALKVSGRASMPQMKDMDSGEQVFKLNRKGDYLMPMDVGMPGGWQVVLSFYKDKRRIYRGKIEFKI